MKKNIFFSILIFTVFTAFSQEYITGLKDNPLIKKNRPGKLTLTKGINDTLQLPFMDDFSSNTIYPDSHLWNDHFAFINIDYPVYPVTLGVATLDALDAKGKLYPNATSKDTFPADCMTSNPINLSAFHAGDSIYLSFYFQPGGGLNAPLQGYGDAPEKNDLLTLEFASYPPDTLTTVDTTYTSTDTIYTTLTSILPRWNRVWRHEGMSLEKFKLKYNTYFKQILIPVNDPVYLYNGFQFRFKNYASLYNGIEPGWVSGNVDQWNLDYIYLDKARKNSDTNYTDVAFTGRITSLLKDYQSIPWSHFKFLSTPANYLLDTFKIPFVNMDNNAVRNVYRYFKIYDLFGSEPPYLQALNSVNVDPGSTAFFDPKIDYLFKTNTSDSAVFRIFDSITTTPDKLRKNDTVSYYQRFYNYYAYDDGVPENGYGYNGEGEIAYRFTNYMKDTLRAVQVYFNQTLDNENVVDFNLTIWDDKNGSPGNIIYQKNSLVPKFEDSLNQYHTYYLYDTSVVINAGNFYVGWVQNSNVSLNIGFDRNINEQSNLIVNYLYPSTYQGALMIRPVFGKSFILQSIADRDKNKIRFKINPNPVHDNTLNIDIVTSEGDMKQYFIAFIDMTGHCVLSQPFNKTIDISTVSNGLYFLKIQDSDNNTSSVTKLIICK